MPQLTARLTATIAISQSISDALALNGQQLAVIEMPASWTPAVLTFQGSMDNSSYFNVYDDSGNEVYVATDAGQRHYVNIGALSRHKYIKLRSGTSVAAITQAAARTIYVEVWS